MVPRVESQGQRDRTGDSVLVIVWGLGSERAAAPAGCGACDGAAVSIIHRKGLRDGGGDVAVTSRYTSLYCYIHSCSISFPILGCLRAPS
jgi:hypothetical protein